MEKNITSRFNELPKIRTGRWAFGLSLLSICIGPILGISAAFIVPFMSDRLSETVGQVVGFGTMIVSLLILVTTLLLSIKAYRTGERSWAVWVALALSITSVGFLIFMLVGELLFPH